MVAGRNASGIASELGTMKVPNRSTPCVHLAPTPSRSWSPREWSPDGRYAPILTIVANLVGLGGGWLVSRFALGLDSNQYWTTAWQSLQFADVFMGLTKPLLFGFIIATVGCYYGLTAKGGTQGVGRATTQAMTRPWS